MTIFTVIVDNILLLSMLLLYLLSVLYKDLTRALHLQEVAVKKFLDQVITGESLKEFKSEVEFLL